MSNTVRMIILLVLVVVIIAIVAVFMMSSSDNGDTSPEATAPRAAVERTQAAPTEPPTPDVTATPKTQVVIAIQNITRGSVIRPSDVALHDWPTDVAQFNNILLVESDAIGKRARTDIFVEQPILTSMVVDSLDNLASVGSDVAAIIPPGQVAISVPIDRLTSVAYAIQPGDHVDIIASLLYVEVDEDFQSRLPNNVSFIGFIESEGNLNMGFGSAMDGRIETERLPYTRFDITTVSAQQVPIEWPVMVNPYEPPRPRLTTQRTVTDALVMHIGNFPLDGVLFPTPTPEATHEVAPVVEEAPPQQQANVPATAVPTEVPMPDIVTLAVSPQQAVTLTYMIESHIPLTFVLRAANDLSQTPTSQVTLRYIMEQYEIVVPTKEEFAIEPAIRSIRQTFAGDTISLSEE